MNIQIKKQSGEIVPFDKNSLHRSLINSGTNLEDATKYAIKSQTKYTMEYLQKNCMKKRLVC